MIPVWSQFVIFISSAKPDKSRAENASGHKCRRERLKIPLVATEDVRERGGVPPGKRDRVPHYREPGPHQLETKT